MAARGVKREREPATSPPPLPSSSTPSSSSASSPATPTSPSRTVTGEVIFFQRPVATETTLWVGHLPAEVSSEQLYAAFSRFGPVFDVSPLHRTAGSSSYFAFVQYYSAHAARLARYYLHGHKFLGEPCVVHPKSQNDGTLFELDVRSCISLANHYIGWNEWSSQIIQPMVEEEMVQLPNGAWRGTFACQVKLSFKVDGLSIVGEGRATCEDPSRITVRHHARKKAVTDALKCAFSGVSIVLLPNGKRTVHLLPRSLDYWIPQSGDNTDDTNFVQPTDELFGVMQRRPVMGSAMPRNR